MTIRCQAWLVAVFKHSLYVADGVAQDVEHRKEKEHRTAKIDLHANFGNYTCVGIKAGATKCSAKHNGSHKVGDIHQHRKPNYDLFPFPKAFHFILAKNNLNAPSISSVLAWLYMTSAS